MQRYILIAMIIGAALSGCKKMSYFQTNPNAPSSPISSSILTSLEKNLFTYSAVSSTGTNEDGFFDMATVMQYNVGFDNHCAYSQSYQWVTTDMNDYLQIRDAGAMITAAAGNNAYVGIGKLFEAIRFYYVTNKFGDVPCSQADQLTNGEETPVYDPQKKVYQAILADLDTANNLLSSASGGTITGDFIYNGDLTKWRKFVNSFRLRVILSLSNKTGDPDLKPMTLFADVMNNPSQYPLFASNSDNAEQQTNTVTPTPFYNNPAYVYYGLAQAFADTLIAFQDPRLVHWAGITAAALQAGKSVNDYSAYAGLPSDASTGSNTTNAVQASIPNTNYFYQAGYEPNLYEGYYEVNLLIAEGIARGWWSGGDAATYYQQGITASMSYYGIVQDTINRYLAGPDVTYDPARGLQQILLQRWLGGVYNSGFEPYFTQRRTGYPVMAVAGPGMPNHQEALRWQYPVNEYTLNATHVQAAVTSEFAQAGDVITAQMWVLVPE